MKDKEKLFEDLKKEFSETYFTGVDMFKEMLKNVEVMSGPKDRSVKPCCEQNEFGDINVIDNDTNFTIEVLAPGFDKNELGVTVKDGLITIKGTNSTIVEKEGKTYLKKGFSKKAFSRTYKLTDKVDLITDKIEAKFENGILYVTIEKKKVDEPKPTKIEIK